MAAATSFPMSLVMYQVSLRAGIAPVHLNALRCVTPHDRAHLMTVHQLRVSRWPAIRETKTGTSSSTEGTGYTGIVPPFLPSSERTLGQAVDS